MKFSHCAVPFHAVWTIGFYHSKWIMIDQLIEIGVAQQLIGGICSYLGHCTLILCKVEVKVIYKFSRRQPKKRVTTKNEMKIVSSAHRSFTYSRAKDHSTNENLNASTTIAQKTQWTTPLPTIAFVSAEIKSRKKNNQLTSIHLIQLIVSYRSLKRWRKKNQTWLFIEFTAPNPMYFLHFPWDFIATFFTETDIFVMHPKCGMNFLVEIKKPDTLKHKSLPGDIEQLRLHASLDHFHSNNCLFVDKMELNE